MDFFLWEFFENTVRGLMPILEEKWKIYEQAAIPAEVGPIVRRHMRRAYYAGLKTAFEQVATLETIDEAAVDELLANLAAELTTAIEQIQNNED